MLIHDVSLNLRKCVTCGFTKKGNNRMIDWTKPGEYVSEHFTVRECLWLPTWHRMATEADGLTDEIKQNIVKLCGILERVRTILGCPLTIHSIYRPPEYSKLVGGTEHDVHTTGQAADMDFGDHMSTDDAKKILLPKLEDLGLRMEDNGPASSWVHLDEHPVIHSRFFKA